MVFKSQKQKKLRGMGSRSHNQIDFHSYCFSKYMYKISNRNITSTIRKPPLWEFTEPCHVLHNLVCIVHNIHPLLRGHLVISFPSFYRQSNNQYLPPTKERELELEHTFPVVLITFPKPFCPSNNQYLISRCFQRKEIQTYIVSVLYFVAKTAGYKLFVSVSRKLLLYEGK